MSTPYIPAKRFFFHGYSQYLFEGFLLIGYEKLNLGKWSQSKTENSPSPKPEVLFSIYNNPDITHINDYSEEQMTIYFNKSIKKLKDFDKTNQTNCQFMILPEENNQQEEISSNKVIYAMGYYIYETEDFGSISYSIPKCMVFLSKYPYFSQLSALSYQLHSLMMANNSNNPLEDYLTHLIKTCSSPITTEIHLPNTNTNEVILFEQLTSFPLIDYNLREILTMIPIQTTIEIFILSFLDVNIVLNCNDKHKLFLFIYALECLKNPFGFVLQSQQMNLNESDYGEKFVQQRSSTTVTKPTKGKKSDTSLIDQSRNAKSSIEEIESGNDQSSYQACFKYLIDGKSNILKSDSECFIVDLNDPQAKIDEKFTKSTKMKKYFKKFKKELSKGKNIGTRLGDLKEHIEKEFKNETLVRGISVLNYKSQDDNEQTMNKKIQNIFYNFMQFFYEETTNMFNSSERDKKLLLDSNAFFSLFKETEHFTLFNDFFKKNKFSSFSIIFLEFIKLKYFKDSKENKIYNSNIVHKYTKIIDQLYTMGSQINNKSVALSFHRSMMDWVNYKNELEGEMEKQEEDDDLLKKTHFLFSVNYRKSFNHHIYLNNLERKPIIDIASILTVPYFDILNAIEKEFFENKVIVNANELITYCFLVIFGITVNYFNISKLTYFITILNEICDQKYYFITKYLNLLFTIYLKILVEKQRFIKEFTEEEANEYQNYLSSTLIIQSILQTKDHISCDYGTILRLLENGDLEKQLDNEQAKKREAKRIETVPLNFSLQYECRHPISTEVKLDTNEVKQNCDLCKKIKTVLISISNYNIEDVQLIHYNKMYSSCLSLLERFLKEGNFEVIRKDFENILPNLAFYISKFIIPTLSPQKRKEYTIETHYFFEICFKKIKNMH